MKNHYRSLFVLLLLSITSIAMAQTPAITFHTDFNVGEGEATGFNLAVGSVAEGSIGVNCGYGIKKYDVTPATFDPDSGYVVATIIPCLVSEAGKVDIYCYDGTQIDYFNGDGSSITTISFNQPEDLDVLYLRHNYLQALDLTEATNLSIVDLGDNPFDVTPLIIGANKPRLQMLVLDMVGAMDPSFNLSDYPSLYIFEAYSNYALTAIDPTGCPDLVKLSIDGTAISSIDISHNPKLQILNVNETNISTLDLSTASELQQLYCVHRGGQHQSAKMARLDVSACPKLVYLFASGNKLTEIDVTNNPLLQDLYLNDNYLTHIDLSNNPNLINVMLQQNCFDFNTLPVNPGTWQEYVYDQRPLPTPSSYLVGTALDFASQVIRPDGSVTEAVLIGLDETAPDLPYYVASSAYTFDNGILTIHEVLPDSVYAMFGNTLFDQAVLRTASFKVKDESTYGKPDLAISMTIKEDKPDASIIAYVGMAGATEQNPKKFYVDFGDGEMVECQATTHLTPAQPNVNRSKTAAGALKIYVPEGEKVTAFSFGSAALESIDLAGSIELSELTLTDTHLASIDLSWNRCLRTLTLTGNDFADGLSLEGINGYYYKNVLADINLSSNQLPWVKMSPMDAINTLDISNNCLTEFDFTDADYITRLDASGNQFEYLKLNYLGSLTDLNVSNNQLSELVLPETNVIEKFDLRNNRFTFANMPEQGNVPEASFLYAPQQPIDILEKGTQIDLASQLVTVKEFPTKVKVINVDTEVALTEGTDYRIADGVVRFLAPASGMKVRCTLTNAAYPALSGSLALATTVMEVAQYPTHLVAQFTTPDAVVNARLAVASTRESDVIYIDWAGNGELKQYELRSTFTQYSITTVAGATAKMYSFDSDCQLSVFSLTGVKLQDVDLTGLPHLSCLSLSDARLNEIKMPNAPDLKELILPGSNFTEFDLSPYTKLTSIDFSNNKFVSANLTGLSSLQLINFSNNAMEQITFGGNTALWHIALTNNKLTELDLSEAPAAYQVFVNENKLRTANFEGLTDLRVVYLDHNEFTFATLPLPRAQWTLYIYGDQAKMDAECIDGEVDLSSQAWVGSTGTQYYWSIGTPVYSPDEGGLVAEWLTEDVDFVVNDGVTTFLSDFEGVVCTMMNEVFPSAYMLTKPINISTGIASAVAGIAIEAVDGRISVTAEAGTPVTVCSLNGTTVAAGSCDLQGRFATPSLTPGCYIVRAASRTAKVML